MLNKIIIIMGKKVWFEWVDARSTTHTHANSISLFSLFCFNFGEWSFFSIFFLFAVVSPFCARVQTMYAVSVAIYGRVYKMCCGCTNDNHEINMSERTSACHPFTSQHTHTLGHRAIIQTRRRSVKCVRIERMAERWRASEREREINGYNYKQMTRRTICAKSFHLYRRHYSPKAMGKWKKRRKVSIFLL